jgi:hypothetical protein
VPVERQHFFILGLPRSRTAWCANFLTHGPSFCFHEPLLGCASFADLEAKFRLIDTPFVGASGSGSAFYMDELYRRFQPTLVMIRRNPTEVDRSLTALGLKAGALNAIVGALERVRRA